MRALRTPDDRFADLPDFPWEPTYVEVDAGDGSGDRLRMALVDEGPRNGPVVLCLHGEPSWSFLYRKLVPILVDGGCRVVCPDLVGFGRSDKPASRDDYTYARHVEWLREALFDHLDLRGVTLVCQDWGGLLGLRLVAEREDRFARVVAANTFLPTGEIPLGKAFEDWKAFSQNVAELPIGFILQGATVSELPPAVVAAYDAPFPDESYKEGARQFPLLVPGTLDDPGAVANREAWKALERFSRPFLCAFSDQDPITRGGEPVLRSRIPGAAGQAHLTLEGGGHFLQEDVGEELARVVLTFLETTALGH